MNSAHQTETVEISDAELDNISGGLNPHASVAVGTMSISDSDVLAQANAVKSEVVSAAGQSHQASVSVSV